MLPCWLVLPESACSTALRTLKGRSTILQKEESRPSYGCHNTERRQHTANPTKAKPFDPLALTGIYLPLCPASPIVPSWLHQKINSWIRPVTSSLPRSPTSEHCILQSLHFILSYLISRILVDTFKLYILMECHVKFWCLCAPCLFSNIHRWVYIFWHRNIAHCQGWPVIIMSFGRFYRSSQSCQCFCCSVG